MNDKTKLTQAAILTALAIVFCIATAYIPFLGLLVLILPVPYAIISTISGCRFASISAITSFLVLSVSVGLVYALNLLIIFMLPGIAVGYGIKQEIKIEEDKSFTPIYFGMIVFTLSIIVFFAITKLLFNIDLLAEILKTIQYTVEAEFAVMKSTNMIPEGNITVKDMVNIIQSIIPTMLIVYSIITSLITYYVEAFILKRLKKLSCNLPNFSEFYLPGNPIVASLILYLLVMFLDMLNMGLNTQSIMLNIQCVFSILFLIQGVSVFTYFIKRWKNKSRGKIVFAIIAILLLSGSMILSFVGMLDSIIDFRKVRNYKST